MPAMEAEGPSFEADDSNGLEGLGLEGELVVNCKRGSQLLERWSACGAARSACTEGSVSLYISTNHYGPNLHGGE
jgi:hypothetical protein